MDNFVRQYGGAETENNSLAPTTIFANYTGGTHRQINCNPWDGTWHNLTEVAQMVTNEPYPVIQGPFTTPYPTTNTSVTPNVTNYNITITFNSMPLDNYTTNTSGFLTTYGNADTEPDTNQNYRLQVATSLSGPWVTVSTNAATVGYGCQSITDTNATNATAFYRVLQPGVRLQAWSIYMDGKFISSSLQYTNPAAGTANCLNYAANVNVPVGIPIPNPPTDYLQNTGNMPGGSDPDAIQPPWGIWYCNLWAVGGLFRTTAGSYLPAGTAIDEVAVWKRALSQTDISNYMANGIPNPAGYIPLFSTLTEDFPAVAVGDVQNLNWSGSKNASSIVLQPGSIALSSPSGSGVYTETITTNITNTLVVTRASISTNSSPVVTIAVPGVSSCWHYIDSFTYLNNGPINGQGAWNNPSAGVYAGLFNMEVYTGSGGNKYASFDGDPGGTAGNGGLAGRNLGGDSIPVNGDGTLFFRFYLDPSVNNPDAVNLGGLTPDVDCNVGLTDMGLRDPIDFDGLNGGNGPAIFIVRNQGGAGGVIDLNCSDGPAAMALSPGGYKWSLDTYNNPSGNSLDVGVVYDTWIDFTNEPAEVSGGLGSGGTQTNGCIYRVWLQEVTGPNAWPNRSNLFAAITVTNTVATPNFAYPQGWLVSARDLTTNGLAGVQPASELLNSLYLCTSKNISPEDTNMLRFDDFYLSSCGYNSTLPVADPAVAAFGAENTY